MQKLWIFDSFCNQIEMIGICRRNYSLSKTIFAILSTKEKATRKILWLERKRWDSNPRALAGYLISSQARYDHFDTLPFMSIPRPESNAYSVFLKLPSKLMFPSAVQLAENNLSSALQECTVPWYRQPV